MYNLYEIFLSVRDYFISKELLEKDKNEILTTEKLLFTIFSFFFFLIGYTLYFFAIAPFDHTKNITNVCGIIALALTAFSLKWTNNRIYIILILNLVCFVFNYISLMHSGGIYSIDLEWYLLNSVCAFIFISIRVGIFVTIANAFLVSSLFFLELIHYKDFKTDSIKHNGFHDYFTFLFVQLICAFVVYFFIKVLHKTKKELDLLNNQKIEELNELVDKRTQENISLRADIARDFHDVMGNKLASISYVSEMLTIKDDFEGEQLRQEINKINKLSKEIYEGTRDFIWAINIPKNTIYHLYCYINDAGERIFDNISIDYISAPIDEEVYKVVVITPSEASQLVLIMKEAMTNVLNHSKASKLTFFIEKNENEILFSLSDDGQGFEVGTLKHGNGLRNIKNRAAKINVGLSITSSPLIGTKITVSYPYNQRRK